MRSNSNYIELTRNAAPSKSIPLARTSTSSIDANPSNNLVCRKLGKEPIAASSSSSGGDRQRERASSALCPSTKSTSKGDTFVAFLIETNAINPTNLFLNEYSKSVPEPLFLGSYSYRENASSLPSQFQTNTHSRTNLLFSSSSGTRSNSVSEQSSPLPASYLWEQPQPKYTIHNILMDLSLTSKIDQKELRDHNTIISGQLLSENLNIGETVKDQQPINIIFLGKSGAGKSSLLRRIINDTYKAESENLPQYSEKEITVCNKNIKLKIHDIQDDWNTFAYQKYNKFNMLDVIVICFDVTDKDSMNSIKRWAKETEFLDKKKNFKIFLVATKCDLIEKREVAYAAAKEYADSAGYYYFETSAKESMHHDHVAAAMALAPFTKEHMRDHSLSTPINMLIPIPQRQISSSSSSAKQSIQTYTDALGIMDYLSSSNIPKEEKNYKKIEQECRFTIHQLEAIYPQKQISHEAIEKAKLNFARKLAVIPPEIVEIYHSIRKEFLSLTDSISNSSASFKATGKAMKRQQELVIFQRQLEGDWPQIKYRWFLDQARGIPIQDSRVKEVPRRPAIPAPFFADGSLNSSSTVPKFPFVAEGALALRSRFFRAITSPTPILDSSDDSGYKKSFAIVLVGGEKAGRACLIHRFIENSYGADFRMPMQGTFKQKIIETNGTRVRLEIRASFTPPSQEIRYSIPLSHEIKADAVIVTIDVTNRSSFEYAIEWLKKLSPHANHTVTLAATKCDEPRSKWEVEEEEIKALAEEFRKNVFFTSAKTEESHSIEELFKNVTQPLTEIENKTPRLGSPTSR